MDVEKLFGVYGGVFFFVFVSGFVTGSGVAGRATAAGRVPAATPGTAARGHTDPTSVVTVYLSLPMQLPMQLPITYRLQM